MQKILEVEYVEDRNVSCSGGEDSDHPKVYLFIDAENKNVVCPYCSKKFILTTK